jgi:hypothetical protein
LHDVHTDGQTAASACGVSGMPESAGSTQKPSMQLRSAAQSLCLVQAKSPLRWLTEQPESAMATASHGASFMAILRS